MTQRLAFIGLLLCGGCILQGGARAGASMAPHTATTASWGGQLSAAYEDKLHAGIELEGRATQGGGSTFGSGLQLGYFLGSDGSAVRLGAHADTGLAFGWSSAPAWYAGVTAEVPWRLASPSPLGERNRNFRFVGTAPWLVPFMRYRFYQVGNSAGPGGRLRQHDVSLGLALRLSYTTDLL